MMRIPCVSPTLRVFLCHCQAGSLATDVISSHFKRQQSDIATFPCHFMLPHCCSRPFSFISFSFVAVVISCRRKMLLKYVRQWRMIWQSTNMMNIGINISSKYFFFFCEWKNTFEGKWREFAVQLEWSLIKNSFYRKLSNDQMMRWW